MKDPLFEGKALKEFSDLIYDLEMEKECFFGFQSTTAYSPKAKELSEIAPDLLLKINADTLDEVREAQRNYKAAIVETSIRKFTDEYKTLCRELRLKTMIWEPRWNVDLFEKTIQSGADMINLDDPHLFLQIKKQIEDSESR